MDAAGKIFMDICGWDPKSDGLLDYDKLEDFMRFLDKYVRHNFNGDMLKDWTKQNHNKAFIHKVRPGDLAYFTLVYEAKRVVWVEGMLGLSGDQLTAKPKYHKEG